MSTSNPITATLIPGDGIGPETVDSTMRILDALGSPFQWDVQQAGMAGVDILGDPLPEQTLASIRKHRLALKGPLTSLWVVVFGHPMFACGKSLSSMRMYTLPKH
jgi:isocitrate dehydrogenase (NAD+)